MSKPSKYAAKQAAYRRTLAARGLEQVTVNVSQQAARIMRDLAAAHSQTHGRIIEAGILAAAKRLTEMDQQGVAARGASPALTRPSQALADLQGQLAELTGADTPDDDDRPPMRASEARAIALGLAVGAHQ